ncbi:MAG: TadE family protein [Mobilitalea sp.]
MINRIKQDNNRTQKGKKNEDRYKCIKFQGSVTIEAVFVMPVVIFSIFTMIYLAFYLHDINRIQGMLDKTLYKASTYLKHEADLDSGEVSYQNIGDRGVFYFLGRNAEENESEIQKYLQQKLSYGLFITQISDVKIKVGEFKVTAYVEADSTVTMIAIKKILDPITHNIVKGEAEIHNPGETIRRIEVILDTGAKIKGVSELKEKLNKIFKK